MRDFLSNLIDQHIISLRKIKKSKFIIDKNSCSYFFENLISKKNKILNLNDPIHFLKAIKGRREIENIKKAHIYDGVALTKYLYLLYEGIITLTNSCGIIRIITIPYEINNSYHLIIFYRYPTIF